MKRYFSFDGRIGRLEYFLSFIVFNACSAVLNLLERAINPNVWAVCYILLAVPLCWFLWAQGAKRCHDLGHNGWWQLIPFYWLWMLFAQGNEDTNEYGAPDNKNVE